MKKYFNNQLPLLKLLTAISFLLIYAAGEKLGAFMFMLLIMYPLLIADGSGDLLSLNLNPAATIFIDIIFLGLTYISIYYLMRSGIKKINDRMNDRLCILSILILYIFVYKIFLSPNNSAFSLIMVGIFMFLSLLTILVLLSRQK